jgi:hypothetical protein
MSGTTVEVCDNCGSPLEVDLDGRCRWCHAHIRVKQQSRPQRYALHADVDSMVPGGTDDCSTSSPFLYLLLAALGLGLSHEPVVQDYLRDSQPFHQAIRALTTAVSAAGVRVRDAGLLNGDFDMNLKVYTAEEIWLFDLAVDVLAVVGTLDGLPGQTRARMASDLRSLDQEVTSHTWKKELKRAGDGPERFRELRSRVPRHHPHPGS